MSRLFVITGPSGVGKGTLIRALRESIPGIEMAVSATTRAPRPAEIEGVDYYFLGPEEFERRVRDDEFVEHAAYSGNRYGTLRSEVERRSQEATAVVLEIELQGARQVRESMPGATLVFIAPPSPETLRQRLESRGTDERDAIDQRLETAAEELAAQDEFQHVIVNDDVGAAARDLIEVVRSELP